MATQVHQKRYDALDTGADATEAEVRGWAAAEFGVEPSAVKVRWVSAWPAVDGVREVTLEATVEV